jgi:hypothetical protein
VEYILSLSNSHLTCLGFVVLHILYVHTLCFKPVKVLLWDGISSQAWKKSWESRRIGLCRRATQGHTKNFQGHGTKASVLGSDNPYSSPDIQPLSLNWLCKWHRPIVCHLRVSLKYFKEVIKVQHPSEDLAFYFHASINTTTCHFEPITQLWAIVGNHRERK